MTRKRRERQRRTKRRQSKTPTQWVEFIRKNDLFEQYYKIQQIVPEDEFPVFMEAIQSELPSTFRITGTRSHAQELLNAIRKFFLTKLETVQSDGAKADPPKPLPWYPDELAWQINFTKRFIRKSSCMDKFHKFLVHETETGNISRQEAVSMIPPMFLDVKPGQMILDACAAPGSKTVQLIELLHGEESSGIPDGLVVANELQNKRCYMLVHQSKRLHSPCCLITNHDAALFPTMFIKGEDDKKVPLLFDRILCDVPCSGDGTLRKNPLIWKKWNPQLGVGLFRIQLRILARAVEMLTVGGRIVYSTCTLNPIEDEAVICNLLQKAEGAIELVDVSSYLPNLKRSPGLKTWKVMTKDMEIVVNCDPGTDPYIKGYKPEMLAPSDETASKLHLERCMRIYPHQQDTGGFFIAVLQKKRQAPWENDKRCSTNPRLLPWETEADRPQRKKQEMGKKEGPELTLLEKQRTEINSIDQEKVEDKTERNDTNDVQADTGHVVREEMDCPDAASNDTSNIEDDLVYHDTEIMNVDVDENEEDCDELAEDGQADGKQNNSEKDFRLEEEDAQNNASTGDTKAVVQPPRKKAKVEMRGFKEDPFVFLKDDDEHWPQIKEFYGIDDSFPVSQLLVRSVGGKKRNIYLVSKAVKDVMEMVDGNHKVVNTGMKVIARAESDNVGCFFRLMQEGIEVLLPFINKRKVLVTQEDVLTLLTQDRPFCAQFSSTTRQQFDKLEGQGCIVYRYDPKGPYSKPEDTIGCRLLFCGWKARLSTRVQINKFDKAHYRVLCGIPPEGKDEGKKTSQRQEDKSSLAKTSGESTGAGTSKQGEEEEQAGFIGDLLNLEAPAGSLDVGFI